MASTDPGAARVRVDDRRDDRDRHPSETKPFFMTSEFLTFVATVVGILIAVKVAKNFIAPGAWQLITFAAIGYMISRGLAKSGSRDKWRD
jgi:hypothetical protein